MIIRLKHVKRVRVKGRSYFYHAITRERLPDDREERAARVLEVNRTSRVNPRVIAPGSIADIITKYKRAPEFRSLRPKTRHVYALYLDTLCEMWGPYRIADIRRHHLLGLRDKHLETPSKANMVLTVSRIVLAFAVERGYREDNPAIGLKRLKTGDGHATWTQVDVDHFLETAPPMMVLALRMGLYTGQREGDCLAMCWSDYDGELIHVVQGKTGTKLWIPVHSDLKAALVGEKRVSPIILTTTTGRPFTGSNFRHHFGKAMRTAGLEGRTFHGLRYTAAARLAEAGCSLKEIAAITGHRSLAMLEKYSRDADQKRLAGAAIHRLENVASTKNGKPR